MKVRTTAAINALKKFARWIEKIKEVDEDVQNEAVNIVIGCFQVMTASPTTGFRAWVDRQPRRKKLKSPAKAVQTKAGRRAIAELITLTISELEANKPFWTEVEVGPLPVGEPRRLSEAQILALDRGRRQHNRAMTRWREEQTRRRSA